MFTILIAVWMNDKAVDVTNKRLDDMNRRFDDVDRRFDGVDRRFDELRADINHGFREISNRLDRIEIKLDNREERLVRVGERTSPCAPISPANYLPPKRIVKPITAVSGYAGVAWILCNAGLSGVTLDSK